MSDAVDRWSFPWHDLQRRLADGFGAEAAAGAAGKLPCSVACKADTPAASWMMRARRAADHRIADPTTAGCR